MSTITDIPELKRIQFFTGQRLTAQDLTDLQTANRELRWLHNRSLHGWGIGIGFGVTGDTGDTSVTVSPGYAIDCLGREIILTDPVSMTIPAVAGNSDGSAATYYLTVSWLDDQDQSVAEQRAGVCLPGGTVRLTETPLIQWQQLKDIQEGTNLILAQASILNCQLNAALILTVRRQARPSQQPFIASGQTVDYDTVWSVIDYNGQAAGVTTTVDTSAAGFQTTPQYFAHVMGPRVITVNSVEFLIYAIPVISSPAAASFNCDVYMAQLTSGGMGFITNVNAILPNLEWSVVWMGIEG